VTESISIVDADDPRLADYVGLRDPARRVRVEREHSFFVGEGELVVRRMVERRAHGLVLRSVLVTPRRYDALASVLADVGSPAVPGEPARPVPVYVAPDDVLRAVAGFDLHRGAVAAADRPAPVDAAALLAACAGRVVLALERVNDHENLGSLFRSAAALGAGAVLLDGECSDPLYRRCVRVSMGHVLTVPWAVVPSLTGQIDGLHAHGFTVAALTPGGDTTLDELASTQPDRPSVALLLGAEGPGLRAETLAAADVRVRIPMATGVDSLNVAVAAAIATYALTR
jgi:tRNA G18 (ribose-2'-O)-methylase SpoU